MTVGACQAGLSLGQVDGGLEIDKGDEETLFRIGQEGDQVWLCNNPT